MNAFTSVPSPLPFALDIVQCEKSSRLDSLSSLMLSFARARLIVYRLVMGFASPVRNALRTEQSPLLSLSLALTHDAMVALLSLEPRDFVKDEKIINF